MEDNLFVYVISPVLTALIAGVGFLAKRWIANSEKKREEEMRERNETRNRLIEQVRELENGQKELQQDLMATQAIILKCEHPGCPSRQLLSDYLTNKSKRQ